MSVLETFFYLFDADARKLEQGVKDSDRAVDKLQKNLDQTDKTAGLVGGSLLKLAYAAGAALGGIMSVGAIASVTMEVANFADELNDAADAIGVNVSELHAWDNAATTTGGQAKAFTASLNTLNTGMNSIATKGKGLLLPFFEELGLSMDDIKEGAKDPLSAMLKLSDSFQKLSKAERAGLGAKMGLDQGTINLLSEGREGVLRLVQAQKDLGVVTKEQAEEAAKFNDELEATGRVYEDVKRQIVLTFLHAATWVIEKLRDTIAWMRDHKAFVLTFFGAVAAMLVGVYAPAAWAAATATWALIGPYVAVGAAILAFAALVALVAEDLYNFQQGNDSVTGELAKKWSIIGDVIHAIGDALTWLIAIAEAVFSTFVALIVGGPQAAIDNFTKKIRFLISDISDKFPKIGEVFQWVFDSMTAQLNIFLAAWDWLVSKIQAGLNLFLRGVDAIAGLQNKVAGIFGFQFQSPAPAIARAATAPVRATVDAAPTGLRVKSDPLREGSTGPTPVAPPRPAQAAPRGVLDASTGQVTSAAARRPVAAVDSATPEGRATRSGVEAGRQQLAATSSPIVAQSSNAITNSTTNRTTTKQTEVNIERVEVNTQASDGPAVASALSDHLGTQLRGAIDQNDDGVLA